MDQVNMIVAEVEEFFNNDGPGCIAVEDYVKQTQGLYVWTTDRKVLLYKAIHVSQTIAVSYIRDPKEQLVTTIGIR